MRSDTATDKPLILVIEDEEAIKDGICEILDFYGYRVLGASDGQEGFDMIREHNPDLVLCDVMMPNMDGISLLNTLRADTRYLSLPFIFLTAKSQAEDILEGLKTGADDYLPKPFESKELIQAVEFRLQKHRQLLEKSKDESKKLYLELAGRTSHEMGNILNGLLNGIEILLDDISNNNLDDVDTLTSMIKKAGYDLHIRYYNLEIVHSIHSGQYFKDLDPSSYWLVDNEFVRELLTVVAKSHQSRIKDVKWDIAPEHLGISVDHLSKLLAEIILNSLQYSKQGDEIRVIGNSNGNVYKISIIDSGKGMDIKNVDYTQILKKRDFVAAQQFGLGLGLFIVHKILEFWGGDLGLYSELDKGTLVVVTLPIADMANHHV